MSGFMADDFERLSTLFFLTRQIIRSRLPRTDHADPAAWSRVEVLRFIDEQGDPSMRAIAEYLRVKAPSASALVSQLERDRFVKKESEAKDRRVTRIALTPSGKCELVRYRRKSSAALRSVFSAFDANDMAALRRLLTRLIESHPSQDGKMDA